MKTSNSKTIVLVAICLFAITIVYADPQTGTTTLENTINTKASEVWGWVNKIGALVIVLVFFIGAIVVYSKKDSDQPGEFKRALLSFGGGLAFLVVALGILNWVKTLVTGTSNPFTTQ